MSEFYKNWDASKSQNNNGAVPFYRPLELTPAEKEQACKNIGVASNDAILRLENEFTDLRGDMATVSSDSQSAVAAANSAVSEATSAKNQAIALMNYVTGVSGDIASVSAIAISNSGNIETNTSDISTLSANVASVSGKNTIQDNQISSLSGTVNGLTNNFNTVSAKVDTNASDISALSAAEADDRTDINTLSGNLNTVSGIATSARQEALEAKNTANATSAFCQTNYQNLTSGWSAMQNDWSAFSAAEDAVITAATAAIPGQVSAEVSGQLSGKQDKLTSANAGINISISNAGVIDVKNNACSAGDNYAIALGYHTNAAHYGSFTHGASTVSLSSYAHAEGDNTRAYYMAHSEGSNASALGSNSHAEGNATIASGAGSHAEGYRTSAVGIASHAEGNNTISDTDYQHVEGQYNAPALSALHVIGNGTTSAQRSNIVETYTDRVVVNGDLINDSKDQVLAQFMFDNTQITGTQGKLILKNSVATGSFINKQYNVGNYSYSVVSGITGSQAIGRTEPSGSIIDWDGNVGPVLASHYFSQMKPVSWPTDKLPRNTYNSTNTISYQSFAEYNKLLTELPSGWYNSFTAYCSEPRTYLYHCRCMFDNCTNLTGDVKPWMDFVLTQSGAGGAGNPSREFYRAGMFAGCTGVDNYSTLSVDPTYSAFFFTI